jgi:hypothetical protein
MSSKDPFVRFIRIVTHINIGVALGLVAWVVWSGWMVATGQLVPAHTPAEIRAWMAPPPAAHLQAATTPGAQTFAACHHDTPAVAPGGPLLKGEEL